MYALTIFLLTVALFVGSGYGFKRAQLRTTNRDVNFGRWPNKNAIPYYIDTSAGAFVAGGPETTMIQQALSALTAALPVGCLAFTPVAAAVQTYKLKFTPLTGGAGSQPQTYCYSYPGLNVAMSKVSLEQPLSLARGSTGCLTTYCQVIKYLAIVLGKRNEHQRGDRDNFLTMSASLAIPSAYTKYTNATAWWSSFGYDYCSVTHNQPSDFSVPGTPAFTIPATAPVTYIPQPQLCTLSKIDCQLISMMYGCNSTQCSQPTCATQALSVSPPPSMGTTMSTTPSSTTSTMMTSTTTMTPCVDFCAAGTTIDEGALLLDGRQALFSGTCYQILPAALGSVLTPGAAAAMQISTLFPGGMVTGPIQSIWQTQNPATQHILQRNGVQYACTLVPLSCVVEVPVMPVAPARLPAMLGDRGVFELVELTVNADTFTIASTGTTFIQNSNNSPNFISNVYTPCQASTCPKYLTSWTAAWAPALGQNDIVNVLGTASNGVTSIQQMNYLPGYWTTNLDSMPVC